MPVVHCLIWRLECWIIPSLARLYSVSDTKRVQVDLPNRRKLNNNVNYRITFIMSYFVSQSTEQAL